MYRNTSSEQAELFDLDVYDAHLEIPRTKVNLLIFTGGVVRSNTRGSAEL